MHATPRARHAPGDRSYLWRNVQYGPRPAVRARPRLLQAPASGMGGRPRQAARCAGDAAVGPRTAAARRLTIATEVKGASPRARLLAVPRARQAQHARQDRDGHDAAGARVHEAVFQDAQNQGEPGGAVHGRASGSQRTHGTPVAHVRFARCASPCPTTSWSTWA